MEKLLIKAIDVFDEWNNGFKNYEDFLYITPPQMKTNDEIYKDFKTAEYCVDIDFIDEYDNKCGMDEDTFNEMKEFRNDNNGLDTFIEYLNRLGYEVEDAEPDYSFKW